MDFDFSPEQKLLRNTARDLISKTCPLDRVREQMSDGAIDDAELWQTVADQGWLGLHLPEEVGGLGASLVELAVVAEELGRGCVPVPYLATLWSASLLAGAAKSDVIGRWLPALALGEKRATVSLLEGNTGWNPNDAKLSLSEAAGGFRLDGVKVAVLEADKADVIFCIARAGSHLAIVAIERTANGVAIRPTPALDATRKLFEVSFSSVAISHSDIVLAGPPAESALTKSLQVAALVTCAEMVGVTQRVLEMTVEFAKTREQFDKPIGAFQAVQHHCANMLLFTESARSATYFAAWALSAGAPDGARALSQAKAYCSDAAREVCHLGVQVHGGIGFTWEHDLHLFLKRAKCCEALFGDATYHRELIARMILDGA